MRRPTGRAVLLPTVDRRRRRRARGSLSRALWIASAVLVGGLAAIALDDSAWLEELVEAPARPAVVEPPAGPYGPGTLGLPPPEGTSRPPPPP